MTYDDVLLASDGTGASAAALEHAIRFADAFDATLHVVYALDVAEHPPGLDDPGEHPELRARRKRALDEPRRRAEEADVDVTAVAVREEGGGITDALLEYAREHDVDLVVVGLHDQSGLDRILAGSVAEDVVRTAPVPVVTVRANGTADSEIHSNP